MRLGNPNALWLLLVFPPAMLVFFWWSWRQRQALMSRFIQSRLLPGLLSGMSPARDKLRAVALVLAVACLLFALARPQWGFTWEQVKQRGLDIVMAIDTSKSMLAEDISPNRLARAKLAALELMQRARSDRVGLVAFAGTAFLQCPLTVDDAVFRQSVEALDVNSISEGGTDIADAINTALATFKEGDNHKVLVLFTDGEDQDSGALEAAKKAGEAGLQIFTIGIGTAEGELLRIKDANGQADYIRDEQGNVVKSHLNETLLQQIAGATERGFYLPLRGAHVIDTLYDKGLAPLPKGEGSEKLARRMHERYHWPLGVAILLLVGEMLLPERKRETGLGSATAAPKAAKPLVGAAVAVLLLLTWPRLALGSAASALRDYKAGQYDQALQEYQQLLKRKGEDPRLHFNAGASAYRKHQFDEAAKQFDQALSSPDLNLQSRAYYNRGNSRFYLGTGLPDMQKRAELWKQALQDYQSSMKLNPKDGDAKHNYDFVKKVLEQLQRQQQQQQQSQNNQQQNQDQKKQQQQQQQKPPDQQQPQNQPQQQAQQKQEQQKQKQQQQQTGQQQKPQEQKQQQAKAQQEKQQQEPQQASAQNQNPDEKKKQEDQSYAQGEMTPQQAKRLLDAQKGEEQMLPPEKPNDKPIDRTHPLRDW